MNKTLYTAIIFFMPGHPFSAMKYRKISNTDKFVTFAQKKYKNISSINFYERDTRLFSHQIRINTPEK